MPIPHRHGGTLTVPCCKSCHEMKDSIPLDSWSPEWTFKVLGEFGSLSRETKLFLAKVFALVADAQSIKAAASSSLVREETRPSHD